MKGLITTIAIVAAISVILILPVVASAIPVTYTYIGNAFNVFTDHDPPAGTYDTSNNVEVTLTTIDGVLPDTASIQEVSSLLASWSFTDDRYTVNHTMGADHLYLGVKPTAGSINLWHLVVEFNTAIGADVTLPGSRIQTASRSGFIQDSGSFMHHFSPSSYSFDRGEVNDDPGLWSSTTANPIPEPATALLLIAGLIGITGFRRKFKKKYFSHKPSGAA
jgi:hypothetical protein